MKWGFPEIWGYPSYHPFLDGIVHSKPFILGYPPYMETSKSASSRFLRPVTVRARRAASSDTPRRPGDARSASARCTRPDGEVAKGEMMGGSEMILYDRADIVSEYS